jgi:arylsulfatase A-like enzyme
MAAAVLGGLIPACGEPSHERPNVVFVLVDTLRADHLGTYGYERPTSPNIDAIAKQGYVFEQVRSVCNWTNPTIASLFTGLYPQSIFRPAQHKDAVQLVLPDSITTMAEALKARGYRTAALVDHPGINQRRGYAQGFEDYTQLSLKGANRAPWATTAASHIASAVSDTIAGFGDDPFFLYLHLIYPHAPYDAPRPFSHMFGAPHQAIDQSQRAEIINSYDGEIRYTDKLLGKVFADLEARGLDEDTYFVITSDHGEGFWEHGSFEHGTRLFDEVLHVPLILIPPGGLDDMQRVPDPVSNIDLFPTILELAGAPLSGAEHGRSLTRFFTDSPLQVPVSQEHFMESPHSLDIEAMAVSDGRFKLVRSPGLPESQQMLFDLEADPGERRNLMSQLPEQADRLKRALREHVRDVESRREAIGVEERAADPDVIEALQALGYPGDD